jgi:hypothetical protein
MRSQNTFRFISIASHPFTSAFQIAFKIETTTKTPKTTRLQRQQQQETAAAIAAMTRQWQWQQRDDKG